MNGKVMVAFLVLALLAAAYFVRTKMHRPRGESAAPTASARKVK